MTFYPKMLFFFKFYWNLSEFSRCSPHILVITQIVLHKILSLRTFSRICLLLETIPYGKKVTGLFDVTMGSYDGCEVCELVGLYVLHRIKEKFPEIDFGLYRDDGLGALKRTPKTKLEKIKKDLFR